MKKARLLSLIIGTAITVQSLACFPTSAEYYDDAELIISIFNENEGGYYTEDTDFMIVGSRKCADGMAGAVFLDGFNTANVNPAEFTDLCIDTLSTYTVLPVGRDLDGYRYDIDMRECEPSFSFSDGKAQKVELLMKKNYFVINSEQLSTLTHSEEVIEETGAVINTLYSVINSHDFIALDSTQRVNAVDSLLEVLQQNELISEHSFNDDEKTMEFTYKCGITGTLRPCVFLGRGDNVDDIKPPKRADHDINCDGDFAVSDIISLQNWLVKNERAAYINFKAADLCPDGKIDVFDLIAAKKELINDQSSVNESGDISFDIIDQIKRNDFSNTHLEDSTYIIRSMSDLDSVTLLNEGKASDITGIDESFFNDKSLVLVYKVSGSSSITNTLDRIYSENGILKTEITSISPDICTCDMAYTRIAAAVDKSAVEGLVTASNDHFFYQ